MNYTKDQLIAKRTEFFNDIIYSLKRPLGQLDYQFEQNKYNIILKDNDFLNDPINGELTCSIKGEFFKKKFEIIYSVWQVGTLLKIGFIIKDSNLFTAFGVDENSDILNVWHEKGNLVLKSIHGGLFYDWEFNAENLYEGYQAQENYTMGIRHMHLRIMKIVYDLLKNRQLD